MNHNFDPARISDLHITCLPGLGPVLATELEMMGFNPLQTESTFVRTRGSLFDTYRLNLWLRTASHIHYKIMEFQARDPERMYKQAVNYPWEDLLVEDSYFSIHSVVNNENVRDTRFPNLKLKDAIVDRFYRKKLKDLIRVPYATKLWSICIGRVLKWVFMWIPVEILFRAGDTGNIPGKLLWPNHWLLPLS